MIEKAMSCNKYDAVFYYETNFQKSLVEKIVEQYYSEKNILVIFRKGNSLKIDKSSYYFNFHFRLNSLISFLLLFVVVPKLRKIECDEFVASFFPGINARILSKYIGHNKKCCIEDGLGTPYNIFFPETIISNISLKIVDYLYSPKLLKGIDALDEVDVLYTIYGDINSSNLKAKVIYFDFIKKQYPDLTKEIYFIGQPLVLKKLLSVTEYSNMVNKVADKHGRLNYFYHPAEIETKYMFNDSIFCRKVDQNIEEYIKLHQKPKIIISYFSSVLINIKTQYPNIACYYIDSTLINEKAKYLLEYFGVQKYDLEK
ncbi:MAG: hypothetical protein JW717_05450 [Marinilabiliaceae bacterium]|nr:hypothetical protein [Marinilabiliaceae bacterium]